MLQEYNYQNATKSTSFQSNEITYVASSSNNKSEKKKTKDSNKIVCSYYKKKGHYRGDCYTQKREQSKKKDQRRPDNGDRGHELDKTDKGMITVLSKKEEEAMSASQAASLNPGATVHMVLDDTVPSMDKKLSGGSIGMGIGEAEKVKNEGTSEFQMSEGQERSS